MDSGGPWPVEGAGNVAVRPGESLDTIVETADLGICATSAAED